MEHDSISSYSDDSSTLTTHKVAEWIMNKHRERLPEVLQLLLIDDRDRVQSEMINAVMYRHLMGVSLGGE